MWNTMYEYGNWIATILVAAAMIMYLPLSENSGFLYKLDFVIIMYLLVFNLKTSIEVSAIDRGFGHHE